MMLANAFHSKQYIDRCFGWRPFANRVIIVFVLLLFGAPVIWVWLIVLYSQTCLSRPLVWNQAGENKPTHFSCQTEQVRFRISLPRLKLIVHRNVSPWQCRNVKSKPGQVNIEFWPLLVSLNGPVKSVCSTVRTM